MTTEDAAVHGEKMGAATLSGFVVGVGLVLMRWVWNLVWWSARWIAPMCILFAVGLTLPAEGWSLTSVYVCMGAIDIAFALLFLLLWCRADEAGGTVWDWVPALLLAALVGMGFGNMQLLIYLRDMESVPVWLRVLPASLLALVGLCASWLSSNDAWSLRTKMNRRVRGLVSRVSGSVRRVAQDGDRAIEKVAVRARLREPTVSDACLSMPEEDRSARLSEPETADARQS